MRFEWHLCGLGLQPKWCPSLYCLRPSSLRTLSLAQSALLCNCRVRLFTVQKEGAIFFSVIESVNWTWTWVNGKYGVYFVCRYLNVLYISAHLYIKYKNSHGYWYIFKTLVCIVCVCVCMYVLIMLFDSLWEGCYKTSLL